MPILRILPEVFTYVQQPALRRASLKSMHPNARKVTALSSLPPLMIPLPPALPTNITARFREGASPFAGFDNHVPVSEEKLVLWLQDIVLQLHMPTK
ncbi:hypothetical protein V8E54_012236 [Elaphomyces granulatus]